jgi:hypothetical protein
LVLYNIYRLICLLRLHFTCHEHSCSSLDVKQQAISTFSILFISIIQFELDIWGIFLIFFIKFFIYSSYTVYFIGFIPLLVPLRPFIKDLVFHCQTLNYIFKYDNVDTVTSHSEVDVVISLAK